MTEAILQNRISLRKLKVAEFASEETLCFTAEVLLDGTPIAEARNDGHGGCTFLRPMNGSHARLTEAEVFATSLPPVVTDLNDPNDGAQKFTFNVTLDHLVDHLAGEMHAEKKILAAFNRDISTKVLYVRDNRLLYPKGRKLKDIADKPAFFRSLREKFGPDIVVLAELSREEALALWRTHVVDGDGR
jgi:hypothetical protein